MKLIKDKYQQLQPSEQYLNDEVVMAQAWKKTHAYMRTHNWYADTLALDISALGLESNARDWAKEVTNPAVKLEQIELVPAAKAEKWTITRLKGWRVSPREKKRSLRPLAHIQVRDQTWATAAMMCLADIIEKKQGNCGETDFLKAQGMHVYSYGNRLLCDWNKNGSAWFRWGNAQLYRKYFTDYRNFLKRPVEIGRSIVNDSEAAKHIYVVSLDIKKFYDNIKRDRLINILKEESIKEFPNLSDDKFWDHVNKIFKWEWNKSSRSRIKELDIEIDENFTKGIPQGLVSAGFFANSYLLGFDEYMGNEIGKPIDEKYNITIHDYCRYVDDLRLVVSTDQEYDKVAEMEKIIFDWVNKKLSIHTECSISLNEKKTNIASLENLDNKGALSERVNQMQSDISGPLDRDIINSSIGVLESLLSAGDRPQNTSVSKNHRDFNIVSLTKADVDIRPDTIKRFSANRLEMLIKNKRKIDLDPLDDVSSEQFNNETMLVAKKLIWTWMQDPSLALVLRKALEIYPSPDLAEPIFSSIYNRCSSSLETSASNGEKITSAMMDYLLADLFRCCIDFHSLFQRTDYPKSCNPEHLLDIACSYAQKTLESKTFPEFLERQALLLLAVKQKPSAIDDAPDTLHRKLHAILSSKSIEIDQQEIGLFEVAAQITDSPQHIANQLIDSIKKCDHRTRNEIFSELAKRGGPFWRAVWNNLQNSTLHSSISELRWADPPSGTVPKGRKQLLSYLLSGSCNAFVHEGALIRLAIALIKYASEENLFPVAPSSLEINLESKPIEWEKLWHPNTRISVSLRRKHQNNRPSFRNSRLDI